MEKQITSLNKNIRGIQKSTVVEEKVGERQMKRMNHQYDVFLQGLEPH